MSDPLQPPGVRSPARERIALLRFGGDGFGVPAACCRELFVAEGLARVPLAPPHLLGIVQLRGRVIPLVDIRSLAWGDRAPARTSPSSGRSGSASLQLLARSE